MVTTRGDVKENSAEGVEMRFRQRTSFDFVFALVFLVILHGFSAIKVLVILAGNYAIAKGMPRRYVPVGTWVFNICTLFANEVCSGYRFGYVARLMTGTLGIDRKNMVVDLPAVVRLGEWMDGFGGLMGRWEILFNITVLRLVSFSLDYYWSLDGRNTVGGVVEVCFFRCVHPVREMLTRIRRRTSTCPTSLSETGLPCRLKRVITASGTMSGMRFMRRCI